MKIKSLGLKVSLIVAFMIAVIICIIVYIVSIQSTDLVTYLVTKEARAADRAFAREVTSLQNEAFTNAKLIAASSSVMEAILNNDTATLNASMTTLGDGIDIITVCDANGNVLFKKGSDSTGTNIKDMAVVSAVLSKGTGNGTIIKDVDTGLATCGSAAVKDGAGRIIGAVICGHDLSKSEYVDTIKAENNCEVTIFNGDTRLATTLIDENGNRVVGTKASDTVVNVVLNQKEEYATRIALFGQEYFAYYSPLIIDNEALGFLFAGVTINEALAGQRSMMRLVILVGVACGILCIALVFVFNIFAVSRPLKKIGTFASKIRAGEIGISVPSESTINVHSSDEVGEVARELEKAYIQLQGYVREIKEQMQGLASGDLTSESKYEFHGDFVLIKDAINEILYTLNKTMTDINSASSQVASGSKQVADGANSLAQGTSTQAAAIEELSGSIAEVTEKTKENVEIADKSSKLSMKIKEDAEKGSHQMDEMITAVGEINEASKSISKIIKAIDDIAFQTNILALNAAVEAARAGQHGKGFAVVAEEVRNLASKSAEAAKDTGRMIQNSMDKAELGSHIAEETAASLNDIVLGINESSHLITEIAKVSEEQSRGIAKINAGIDQVAQVVQQNSATAEESAAAAEEMSGQSDILQTLMSHFRLK